MATAAGLPSSLVLAPRAPLRWAATSAAPKTRLPRNLHPYTHTAIASNCSAGSRAPSVPLLQGPLLHRGRCFGLLRAASNRLSVFNPPQVERFVSVCAQNCLAGRSPAGSGDKTSFRPRPRRGPVQRVVVERADRGTLPSEAPGGVASCNLLVRALALCVGCPGYRVFGLRGFEHARVTR